MHGIVGGAQCTVHGVECMVHSALCTVHSAAPNLVIGRVKRGPAGLGLAGEPGVHWGYSGKCVGPIIPNNYTPGFQQKD